MNIYVSLEYCILGKGCNGIGSVCFLLQYSTIFDASVDIYGFCQSASVTGVAG